ncbi:leucine-rich repeat-containing protein 70-like [Sitodiplosis mosellana]|uniref:leucine-rich repeat-containing protein 70-like n=1 Tax=Sitodiplosis mosellana TaxID=263140 RepID=UPI002444E270|nr:leucine-rich repeat-containing protein 70-like [Sitodiplosis mosellana]
MNAHFIYLILLIFTIDHGVCSQKYAYIGECDCERPEPYKYRLTFICVVNYVETNYFSESSLCGCRNNSILFLQEFIGEIEFKNCVLSQIPNNFGNKLTEVPANLLQGAVNLETLDFSCNKINNFDPDTFSAENSLKILYLSHNNISELPVNTFKKLIKLESLDLAHNSIDALPVDIFEKLIKVQKLDLSHNKLSEIPSFLCHNMEKLNEVDFSNNKLMRIDHFVFSGALSLQKVVFANNQLTSLNRQIFDAHSNVTYLDISENQIKMNALANTLSNLENLLHFNASGNPIKNVSNKTFAKNLKLETLSLSHCGLTQIKPGTFSSLSKLMRLDLSYNQLKTLDLNTLPSELRKLKIAGIDSNKFNCSYLEELIKLITPQHLDAISNRVNCSTGNEEELVQNKSNKSTTVTSIEATIKNVVFDIATESAENIDKKQITETVQTEKKLPIPKDVENGTNQEHQTAVNRMHSDLILVKKYLLVMIYLVAIGFSLIVLFAAWKIFHSRIFKSFNATQVIYRRDEIDTPNTVENNTYRYH